MAEFRSRPDVRAEIVKHPTYPWWVARIRTPAGQIVELLLPDATLLALFERADDHIKDSTGPVPR